jgi:hypothetical protein
MDAQQVMVLRPAARSLVLGLARYLQANPHASDTPEGIALWWLKDKPEPALLLDALDFMVDTGLLERLHAADGRERYRRMVRHGDFEAVAHTAMTMAGREAHGMRLQ